MGRELKFRAWDDVAGEFIYSEKVPGGLWRYFKLLEDRGIRHFESEQYIGIHDKNKVDIYEEDYYKQTWEGKEVIGKIIYKDGYETRYWLEPYPHYRIGAIKITGEVIGNTHETPREKDN